MYLASVSLKPGAACVSRPARVAAAPCLRKVSLLWAALLCGLLALAQPARALVITDNTTINYAINDNVYVQGSPTVALVSGGSIGGGLVAYDTSKVNVSGGSIGNTLRAFETSTVNLSGGSIAYSLGAYDTSTVNVSGGSIGGGLGVFGPGATLNVYGTGLSLSEQPLTDQYGRTYYTLTGTLADGTVINKPVYLYSNGQTGAQISQVHLFNTDTFASLRAQVQALAANGTLSAGNAHALLVKLDAAQTALAAGDTAGARDSLTAFVNQVNAFVRTGKLTAAQGTALTAAAQVILNGLG
jgi:hypothetical protein